MSRLGCYLPLLVPVTLGTSACIDKDMAQKAVAAIQAEGSRPDEMPVMLNTKSPFRYPPTLYASKVQGNVNLRIHIDGTGAVLPESTRVLESSGYSAFDSAAVKGSEELRYTPARLKGSAVGLSIRLPVYFRHPDAQPLPGDTVLHRNPAAGRAPAPGQQP